MVPRMFSRVGRVLVGVLVVLWVFAAGAQAKEYVLEDWDGPAPVKSWLSNPQLDVNGWQPAVSDMSSFATSLGPTSWSPRGLYATSYLSLFAQPGTAEWRFKAPGTSTVYRADYAPVLTRTVGCVNLGMRSAAGGWQDTVNGYPGGFARRSAHPSACTPGAIVPFTPVGQVYVGFSFGRQVYCSNSTALCARTGSPVGNSAVFGVQRTRLLQPRFDAYLPGTRLYLTDYDKPTFQAGANTLTDWVRAGTGTVTAKATDTGLGVKRVTVTAPALGGTTAQSKTTEHPCTGDRNDRCPASWNTARPSLSASLTYNVDQLPEGVNQFTVTATDIVDNTSATDTTSTPQAKVDRSVPTNITVTGPLIDDEDHYLNGSDPVAVHITATDPSASDGQQLSGIKTIHIEEAGGATVASKTLTCTGTLGRCAAMVSEDLTADLTALPEGKHTLRAVVSDEAGNTAITDAWSVFVDRTAPTMDGNIDVVLDESAGIADLSWDPVADPALPTGDAGSGFVSYSVRTRPGGGIWTTPQTLPPESFLSVELGAHTAGDSIDYEISVRDRVGNVAVFAASTTVSLTEVTAGDDGDYAPGEQSLPGGPVDPGEDATWRNVDPDGETDTPSPDQAGTTSATRSLLPAPLAATASTSSYDTILCARDGFASPCGTYSGRNAAEYARKYAQTNHGADRNHDYTYYESDCTNFASQVLHFGGMHFMRTRAGINDPRHDDNDLYVKGAGSWWSQKYTDTFGRTRYRNSNSWSVGWVLYNQLMDHGLARVVGRTERLRSGDIIFYWWKGRSRIEDINHVNVVSQVKRRRVFISQHTTDRANETIRAFNDRARADWPSFDRVVLRPVATRFDLQ